MALEVAVEVLDAVAQAEIVVDSSKPSVVECLPEVDVGLAGEGEELAAADLRRWRTSPLSAARRSTSTGEITVNCERRLAWLDDRGHRPLRRRGTDARPRLTSGSPGTVVPAGLEGWGCIVR
ncbi:hypothetical protein ACIRYZ_44040 [Kitasatospora sp. NPDC101155]|uniref:hypothetical protein n=1 Tax=Kitasatospora sp. NPDC101155 TaxID=3364097 RepID=UPI0038163CEC